MSNMNKLFSVVLVLLLSFSALPGLVKAQTSPFDIQVEVDGDNVSSTDIISVERGSNVEVEVRLKLADPNTTAQEVRVEAELKGLEDEDIEDRTDRFDMKPGITYVKTLELNIPEDISDSDLDEKFNLKISVDGEVCDLNGKNCSSEDQSVVTGLIVTAERHDLRIQDIVLRSGRTISAGDNLFLTVWVENKGSNDEDDISVMVSVPELGLSARDKIDELVTSANEDDSNRDRDTDTEAVNFAMKVPSNAESGSYDLVVEVEYNRGRDVVKATESFTVKGKTSAPAAGSAESIITVDTTSQSVNRGEGAIYKFSFANLGSTAKTFRVEATGAELFGSARVDPAFVTVQPGATSEAFVFITAKDDASLGKHLLIAKVMEGNVLVKNVNLEVEVLGKGLPEVTGAASLDQVRRGLEIGFAVLLIILVILGIVIAIGKLRKGGDSGVEEEPGQGEGQSYYYYPRY